MKTLREQAVEYLDEVFGLQSVKQLLDTPTVLKNVIENANEGFQYDDVLVHMVAELGQSTQLPMCLKCGRYLPCKHC